MKPVYSYESFRYGFFIHYIASYAFYKDGTKPATYDEAVDNFDVEGFANDIARMKVQYIIFTAWHYRALPLFPSEVTKKWRPGCEVKRDLLGEIIDAVRAKGIRVVLYTHPRDGHDFVGEERVNCGWGEGCYKRDDNDILDTPNPDTFSYEKWNEYTLSLYQELLDRYGDRIDGIYTDGMGPGRFMGKHHSWAYEYPIINYQKIRQIVKKANPDIAIMQNGFGWLFSNDFIIPEGFFGYENGENDIGKWPACEKGLAMTPFANSWAATGRYGESVARLDPKDVVRFTIFHASCATSGGVCWASGPYCGGGWDVGVMETMSAVGDELTRLGEGTIEVKGSTSWPTVSGDTLASLGYVFASSSRDAVYEYIHVMRMPKDGMIRLPAPEDGAKLSHPRSLCPSVKVCDFVQDENGVSFRLEGEADEVDTIIRLRRQNNADAMKWEWINDSDKRFIYDREAWDYEYLSQNNSHTLGHFEYDCRKSAKAGARINTWFEGSIIEVYGALDPNGGRADILIDDMLVSRVDTKADKRETRSLLFRSNDLVGGIHTFTIVALDDEPFEFDAVRIGR